MVIARASARHRRRTLGSISGFTFRDSFFSPERTGGRQIILSPTNAWEGVELAEPNVWYVSPTWHMIYRGGANGRVGYATASSPLGTWTRSGADPIIGGGFGGIAGNVYQPSIYREGGTLYVYFNSANDLRVSSGPDALNLTLETADAFSLPQGGFSTLGNTHVFKDGSTYHLIAEVSSDSGATWALVHATATSPLGPFTYQATCTGFTGLVSKDGPFVVREGGEWVMWFHGSLSGNLPSFIYRATSTDLVNWTMLDTSTSPRLMNVLDVEVDQVGDIHLVSDATNIYGFWGGHDNGFSPVKADLIAAQAAATAFLTNIKTGLVSWWDLDESSGTRNDAHSSNHLTDNNTVTSDTGVGGVGTAAKFTAANFEYLSLADNAALSTGDRNFTWVGWIYADDLSAGRRILSKGTTGGGTMEYAMDSFGGTNNQIRFGVSSDGSTQDFTVTSGVTLSAATWYFVVAWYDAVNSTINISVNNETPVQVTGVAAPENRAGAVQLGAFDTSGFWNGRKDRFGFYKRVLAADERTYLYNGGAGRAYVEL